MGEEEGGGEGENRKGPREKRGVRIIKDDNDVRLRQRYYNLIVIIPEHKIFLIFSLKLLMKTVVHKREQRRLEFESIFARALFACNPRWF